MLTRRFRALLFRHGVIHHAIEVEQQRTTPDGVRLLKLKRLRLAVKDRLHRIALAMERADQAWLEPVGAVQRTLKMNTQGAEREIGEGGAPSRYD